MKSLYANVYTYHAGLDENDLRHLTKKFLEVGEAPGVVAHYERLDGKGGIIILETEGDPEAAYEKTIQYRPWIDFDVFPITTIEDAFPVVQRVYG